MPGSTLVLSNGAGAEVLTIGLGSPACYDGIDNDLDGISDLVDADLDGIADPGSDPECDDIGDANERLDGVQSYAVPSTPVSIDSAGAVTVDPAQIVFPETEGCLVVGGETWCVGLTVTGHGVVGTGSADPVNGTMSIPLEDFSIGVEPRVGFNGLGPACTVGPVGGVLTTNNFDAEFGAGTFVALDAPVPAAADCGTFTSAINSYFGLPGSADVRIYAELIDENGNTVAGEVSE